MSRGTPAAASTSAAAPPAAAPPFRDALALWIRIGCVGFGGPAAQIALLRREVVERRGWVDAATFERGLALCTFLPGPEAQQLATYLGYRLHGVRGGLAAGIWFVLPGFVLLLALSWVYARFGRTDVVAGASFGLRSAAAAIVALAVPAFARRNLRRRGDVLWATVAGLAMFFAAAPFPLVVAAAALFGALLGGGAATPDAAAAPPARTFAPCGPAVLARIAAVAAAPLVAVVGLAPRGLPFFEIATFFTRAAFVTFGGAYAVLAYVEQAAVGTYGWLSREAMLDGFGLAETTPGPLILVVAYVGFRAAFDRPGGLDPALAGLCGGALATWATFAPSLFMVFLGAPWVDRLPRYPRARAALAGVSAAATGAIACLAAKLLLAAAFEPSAAGEPRTAFGVDWTAPRPTSIALCVAACVGLRAFRLDVGLVVAGTAAAGVAIVLLGR